MKNVIGIIVSFMIVSNAILGINAIEQQENNQFISEDTIQGDSNKDTDEKELEIFKAKNNNEDEKDYNRNNNQKKLDDEYFESGNSSIQNKIPTIMYQTHIQDYGWSDYVSDGVSGTIGKSKRIEAYRIKLENNNLDGNIVYSSYIEKNGWSDSVLCNETSGTIGQSLRIEAIKINLEGDISKYYNIYYRVHIQDYGWLGWAYNNSIAGSEGLEKRIEGVEIKLVKKESPILDNTASFISAGNIYYSTHVQDLGWTNMCNDGQMSGTTGQSKRIEALKMGISGNLEYKGDIEYTTHIQDLGWQSYVKNEAISGTTGKSKRIEALRIRLNGEISNYYDIYYRVHVENYGWLSWTKNDQCAGTEGFSIRIESIEIKLVKKGDEFPSDSGTPFIKKCNLKYASYIQNIGWMEFQENGETSGTVGKGLRLEALTIDLSNNDIDGNVEYSTMIEGYGWQPYVKNGEIAGTTGQSKRVEAIKIKLSGEIAKYYDICYRVQCQKFGWLGWTGNDKIAGTIDGSYRIEAIQVKLCPKKDRLSICNNSMISFVEKNGFKVVCDLNGKIYDDAQGLLGMQGVYVLRVNKQTNVVTVIIDNGDGNFNIAYKRFVCSTGNDTPYGTYYTSVKYRWKELMGPSYGQYSTRIVGGILFHSVPYSKQNPYTLSTKAFNQLGTTCSHGCIRLMCGDAKWIYDNCTLKTRVDIVNGDDPLSKPVAPKIPLNQTWDPTDPNL